MKSINILIIEDDMVDRMAFKRLVEAGKLPFEYAEAGSVSEARKILDSATFDIVITDYLLGDGTAFDILDLQLDCPVIITTGAGNEGIAVRAMKSGAYDYLIKDPERNYLKVLPLNGRQGDQAKEDRGSCQNPERKRSRRGRSYWRRRSHGNGETGRTGCIVGVTGIHHRRNRNG